MLRAQTGRVVWSHVRGTASQSTVAGDGGIDLDRYPVDRLDSPAAAHLIERAQAKLEDTGCATFPRFMRPTALASAASEAIQLAPSAFVTDAEHNAYQLAAPDLAYGPAHVRNLPMRTRVASNAFDEFGPSSALRTLYSWPGLTQLIAAITGGTCFRLADALGCCSVNVFRPGWENAWHFDEAETTVTLCLQPAESGGAFELTPQIRASQDDLAADDVTSVLCRHSAYEPEPLRRGGAQQRDKEGDEVPITTASFEAGTLQIFRGRYSLHRVTPVVGHRDRLVAVLCFADRPGVHNSAEVQRMFWGREAPVPLKHC